MADDKKQVTSLDGGAIEAVRNLTREGTPTEFGTFEVQGAGTAPIGFVYKGPLAGYQQIDLRAEADKWRSRPERRKGMAHALTLSSFCDLVNRHKDASTAVFADIMSSAPLLTAVVDYHETDHSPRFGQHRIGYAFPLSPEWQKWIAADGKTMGQLAFAEFLEDHIQELVAPTDDEREQYEDIMQVKFGTPNKIAELGRGLSITVNSVVANANTLQTGEGMIQFEETHSDKDGKPLKVPGLFMIGIPLFFGGGVVRIPVRLRYRKEGAKINWLFKLYRPEIFIYEALQADVDAVRGLVDLPVYEGSPEV